MIDIGTPISYCRTGQDPLFGVVVGSTAGSITVFCWDEYAEMPGYAKIESLQDMVVRSDSDFKSLVLEHYQKLNEILCHSPKEPVIFKVQQ